MCQIGAARQHFCGQFFLQVVTPKESEFMKDEDLPALRELESCILRVWDDHGEMNGNYTVGRAYDSAYRFCQGSLARRTARASTQGWISITPWRRFVKSC